MANKILLDHNTPAQKEEEMIKALDALLVGQSRAKKRLVRLWMHANSQGGRLRDKNKPAGIIWLLGPSGVGKSHLAHAFAQIIFGNQRALTQIDCTQYRERHDVSGLIGTKPGYIGFDAEPLLSQRSLDYWGWMADCAKRHDKIMDFNKLLDTLQDIGADLKTIKKELSQSITSERKKELELEKAGLEQAGDLLNKEVEELAPEVVYYPGNYPSILLFDEIEKAHRSFHNVLYQIFQEGTLTIHYQNKQDKQENANKEDVSFRNTFVILTANVGEESIKKLTEGRIPGFKNQLDSADKDIYNRVMREVEKQFPSPFIRRIGKQNMIVCSVLSKDELKEALNRLLVPQLLDIYSQTVPITLTLTESVQEHLLEEAYDIKSRSLGMSALQNVFKKLISEPLSVLMAKSWREGGIVSGDIITAELKITKNGSKKIVLFREERKVQPDNNFRIKIRKRRDNDIRTFDILK